MNVLFYLALMLAGVLALSITIRLANAKHGWLWVMVVIVALIYVLYNIGLVSRSIHG